MDMVPDTLMRIIYKRSCYVSCDNQSDGVPNFMGDKVNDNGVG